MRVKLISHTQTPEYFEDIDSLTDVVAYCARVSNPGNQENHTSSEKLIKYLMKHKHWSPFEMVNVVLEVECTRDIARQLLRHRSFSFQEFSQRYADPLQHLWFTERECRMQDESNRQSSLPCEDIGLERAWYAKQSEVLTTVREHYDWALSNGIAKEQARALLPEGLTLSRLYVNGTLRSWIHYIDIRTSPETQKEHRDLAHRCAIEIEKVFPLIKQFDHYTTQEY